MCSFIYPTYRFQPHCSECFAGCCIVAACTVHSVQAEYAESPGWKKEKSPTQPFPTTPLMFLCSHLCPTPSLPLCAASFAASRSCKAACVAVRLHPGSPRSCCLASAHSPSAGRANVQAPRFPLLKAFPSIHQKKQQQKIPEFIPSKRDSNSLQLCFWKIDKKKKKNPRSINSLTYLHLKKACQMLKLEQT